MEHSPNNNIKDIYLTGEIEAEATVGGKALQLALLSQKGFRVPPFFVISVSAFQRHLTTSKSLLTPDKTLLSALESVLAKHFPTTKFFSVRSSAVGEDSVLHSFAGQFETSLRVSEEELPTAILECWLSVFSSTVKEYCSKMNIPISSIKMGVVIQEMIESDLSGVAFSANPQGLLNEAVVVVGRSTGDGIVEGKVPVTSYYCNTTDNLSYHETQVDSPLLEGALLTELLEILTKLSSTEIPTDIEFAIKSGRLYLLQQRPITTLPTNNALIMDNSNIVESYPGLSLPLTRSFVKDVYYKVFRGVAYRCLPNKKLVEEFDPVLREMVGSANGRLYYKISNWYTILKFLPFQKKIIPLWQKMLGVENKTYEKDKNSISLLNKVRSYTKIAASFVGVPRKMKKLSDEFTNINSAFTSKFSPGLSSHELVALYDEIANGVLKNWDITLLNDMYAFVYTGFIGSYFGKKHPDNHEQLTNAYISSINKIESMKPINSLISLSSIAATSPEILEEINAIKNDSSAEEYINKDGDYNQKLREHINIYGDRTLEELKLETPTFRTNPYLLITQINAYVSNFTQITPTSKTLEKLPNTTSFILKVLGKRAKLGIANREISRLNRSRIYGMVRSIFLAIGTNFFNATLIEAPLDIFHLTQEEVFSTISANTTKPFIEIINQRKKEQELWKTLPPYSRLIFAEKEFDKHPLNFSVPTETNRAKFLVGTPCSGGIVEGPVIVVADPTKVGSTSGKILVTRTTDPGWVFLLAPAKGIIAEKGSLLSHTAIISRELQIPSVVGVERATSLLQTGDYIKLNGDTGEIEVLSHGI